MSLNKVSEEILHEAKKRAEKIENEGRSEAKEILTEAKKTAEGIVKAAHEQTKASIASFERKEMASAKILGKRLKLDAKKDIMDKAQKEIENKIGRMDSAKRKKLFDALVAEATSQIPGAKKIYVSEKDADYAKKSSPGLDVCEAEMMGGAIIENAEGTIRFDSTFDTILESTKKRTLKEVSDILF